MSCYRDAAEAAPSNLVCENDTNLSNIHVCAGLHVVRKRLNVNVKSLLDLIQDCRVLLRGHKCDSQPLGPKAASTTHL